MDVDMEVFGAKVEGDRAHLLEVQERLLADKLWEYLVGLGCSPESLDEPCASSTSPELDAGSAPVPLVSTFRLYLTLYIHQSA